jgi:hypothetical protein
MGMPALRMTASANVLRQLPVSTAFLSVLPASNCTTPSPCAQQITRQGKVGGSIVAARDALTARRMCAVQESNSPLLQHGLLQQQQQPPLGAGADAPRR